MRLEGQKGPGSPLAGLVCYKNTPLPKTPASLPSISSPGYHYPSRTSHTHTQSLRFLCELSVSRTEKQTLCLPCKATSGASVLRRMVSVTTNESTLLSPWRGGLVALPEPVTPGTPVQDSWVLEVMLSRHRGRVW